MSDVVRSECKTTLSADTHILYVEDDAQSRLVLKMLLRNRMKLPGLTCFEDSADFEARVQALDPCPAVVFLDIHVRPLDGFQMLATLRRMERFRGVPVVALTASVMVEEIRTLRMAGFDGCLAKPIDLDTFPDLLKRILRGETVWSVTA